MHDLVYSTGHIPAWPLLQLVSFFLLINSENLWIYVVCWCWLLWMHTATWGWTRAGRTPRANRRARSKHGCTSTSRTHTRPRARRSCWQSLRRWPLRRYRPYFHTYRRLWRWNLERVSLTVARTSVSSRWSSLVVDSKFFMFGWKWQNSHRANPV